jgi:hypothetical protein
METYLIIAAAAFGCGIVILLLRNPAGLKRFAASAAGGVAAFAAVDLTGALTGIALVPNLWTVCTAVVLGLPGVVTMLLLRLMFSV